MIITICQSEDEQFPFLVEAPGVKLQAADIGTVQAVSYGLLLVEQQTLRNPVPEPVAPDQRPGASMKQEV